MISAKCSFYFNCLAYNSVRIGVQGETIRHVDKNNGQANRKNEYEDSDDDDDEQPSSTYQQRQQKRVKLND